MAIRFADLGGLTRKGDQNASEPQIKERPPVPAAIKRSTDGKRLLEAVHSLAKVKQARQAAKKQARGR